MALFKSLVKSAALFSKHLSFHSSITRILQFKGVKRLVFPKHGFECQPYCTTSYPPAALSSAAIKEPSSEKPKTAAEGLMEFFDDEKNWGQNDIRVGRAWKTDELRIKSNSDLHKLWYVLLKEKNMLLTMEHECKEQNEYFPNPERIDKVEESMRNLEVVVRERNEAYFKLETGETGERPGVKTKDAFGLDRFYLKQEHAIPSFMNKKWQEKNRNYGHEYACKKFRRLYFEKLVNENRKARNRARNHVMGLIRRFPNLDMEAVKRDFPTVDLEYVRPHHKARGHRENHY